MSDQDIYQPHAIPGAVPLPRRDPARVSSLGTIIERIEEAIDLETASLRTDIKFDIRASNARKSRYLYELNKAVKGLGTELLHANREGILRLRRKLSENEAAISAHLNAVTEVAGLLQQAIEHAEADGTYNSSVFARSGA